MTVRRGEVYFADLSPVVGSEQDGIRPVIIVQNDVGNKFSPTVIAAAMSKHVEKSVLPTHVIVSAKSANLTYDSVVLTEQIRTIDKKRLKERMGTLNDIDMKRVDRALVIAQDALLCYIVCTRRLSLP